ncbi:MAG: PAS domain-containing sensor histidine kinase [ANME-2 cluster archaeon]|nr:PAS domain-containing sensor histidine kinase [ANME-2 cluster archaeon]
MTDSSLKNAQTDVNSSVRNICLNKLITNNIEDEKDKYQLFFQEAKDAIFLVDEAGNFIDVNRSACKFLGYARDELLEMNIKDVDADPRGHEAFQMAINGLVDDIDFEMNQRKKDGILLPVEIKGNIIDVDGRRITMAIARDITPRMQAETEKNKLFLAISTLTDGLALTDANDHFTYVNGAHARIYGYSPAELIGRTWQDLVQPEMIIPTEKALQETLGNKNVGSFCGEVLALRRDGKTLPTEFRATGLFDEKGDYQGHICIVRDITHQKEVEESLRKYAMELETSNHVKDLFTDIIHHDLLNPLNISRNYVEILKDNETEPEKRGYLDVIYRNMVKSLELIENATLLSKLTSLESIEFENLDLKNIIEKVIDNFEPFVSEYGMNIENRITQSIPIRANRIIEEIFTNYISNAIKYGRMGKKITVDVEENTDSWKVKVIDFGESIKDTDKAGIFNRLYSLEKKGVKGSGLGLTIVKKVAELHDLRVWVEDNPEGGAIFVLEVPKS